MSKIYNALNVNNETDLLNLVESLELDDNQYIQFMTVLDSDLSEDGYRLVLENLTKPWMNGSYEKLQEQFSKKKPCGERKLKVEEDTVYDHSWYEVKGQKYPKRTKEGVVIKEAKEVEDDFNKVEEPVKEEKPVSTADPEISKFIEQSEKIIDATTNVDILNGLVNSIEAKIQLATDVEQMNKLGELKTKADTKINAASKAPVVEGYEYNPDDEEWFDVGDKVEFKWNVEGKGQVTVEGTVREVETIGGNRYYNIASYNPEKKRVENYFRVDPVGEEMKRIYDEEDDVEDWEIHYGNEKPEHFKIKRNKETGEGETIYKSWEDVNETCSGGCCSAGSVSGFAKRLGKTPKKKNKKKIPEAIDTKLFKESIYTDTPAESILEGHTFKYFMNEGKWYLSCDNALVKTFDKDVMIESVDEIINGEEPSCGLLEGYSCYEMNLLMEAITADSSVGNGLNDDALKAAIISSAKKSNDGELNPKEEEDIENSLDDPKIKQQNIESAEKLSLKIGQNVDMSDPTTSEIEQKQLTGVDKEKGLAFLKNKTGDTDIEPASKIQSKV